MVNMFMLFTLGKMHGPLLMVLEKPKCFLLGDELFRLSVKIFF